MTKFFFLNKINLMNLSLMKYLFYFMLMMSTLITINSSSWINSWMGMEINLMSFIPLLINNNNKKKSNSMMIYFIIQASASSLLIMMIIMMKLQMNPIKMNMINFFIQLSLLMKLGASPFHWWMPKIVINLNWFNNFIFLTWQKIAPIFMLSYSNNNFMIYLSAMFSILIGAILGINQTLIKLILIYSSINNLGWMLLTLMMNQNLLILYILIYSITNMLICMLMNNLNMNYINQLFKMNNQSMNLKLITMSLFLSLSGLPPFLGFFTKFLTLMMMINNNLLIESMIMIMMALLSISFYMNPMLSMFLNFKYNMKWNMKMMMINKSTMSVMMINMMLSLIIIYSLINNLL
uniref:NADH-ubiquinone oxidoreductase chain 2 n=1 Tax=Xenapatidea procincta TaxID=2803870 RepID=A0A897FZY6_9HYME|nr:NADH dehydrogenase subunit 2 [Xenapatidea procincta]